jgi:hypothetical protein
MRKKNYYAFPDNFKKSMRTLIIKRLQSNLKVKWYCGQNSLCLVCKEQIDEGLLFSRSSHIRHLVLANVTNEIELNKRL